jgi:hypothetical protein
MAAVDPVACRFEIEIGVFDPIERTTSSDEEVVTAESQARLRSAENVENDRKGFAHPEVVGSLLGEEPSSIIALGCNDQKLTVVGRWEDVVGIDVNKVLVAIRADAKGNDFVDVDCKYAWAWRETTGWQHADDNEWTACNRSKTRATALADGHFQNPFFPTCIPDVVHVYYDRLWAKVAERSNLDNGHYDWGIKGTWAEGARCAGMLHWASFEGIKNEYSTGWIS